MGGELLHSLVLLDMDLTKCKQRDGTERYIEWAYSKNFGIMDINVPRYSLVSSVALPSGWWRLTARMQDSVPFAPNGDDKRQETEIKELICFLWDNYLQLYNSENIIIMGVGYAYIGIKMLLLNRSDASPPGKYFNHCSHLMPLSEFFPVPPFLAGLRLSMYSSTLSTR